MLSQSTITEVHELDVLLVGNLAAIAGDILACKTNRYKLGAAHLQTEIEEPSLFPIAPTTLAVASKPKGVQVIRQRIRKLHPGQKYAILEDGKKIRYQILVYGEHSTQWQAVHQDSPFREALLTPYSLVYSNNGSKWDKILQCKEGNLIFYVGKGPNSYEQNYPFIYIYEKMTAEQRQRIKFIVIMQGQTFYQHCPIAHRVLEQQLRGAKFRIIYNATIKMVDYLKRTIRFVSKDVTETIQYAAAYCCMPENCPDILTKNGIDPYNCNQKYLHNMEHDSVYVIGGCTLPTTHSFTAINHQMHVVVANVRQRLDSLHSPSQNIHLSVYRGKTTIRIFLSSNQLLEIVHGYKDHEHQIKKGCSSINFLISEHMDRYLAEKYYNFKSYGLPHFICSPWTQAETNSNEEDSTLSQLQLKQNQL